MESISVPAGYCSADHSSLFFQLHVKCVSAKAVALESAAADGGGLSYEGGLHSTASFETEAAPFIYFLEQPNQIGNSIRMLYYYY